MFELFGKFSQSFMLALVAWPVVAGLCTFPMLVAQYRRFRRVSIPRAVTIYALMLYLLALVLFTLYPVPDNPARFCADYHLAPQLMPFGSITAIPHEGLRAIFQVGMNLLFFVPLGVFIRSLTSWRLSAALLVGLSLSIVIETAQLTGAFGLYPCSYRLFDVDDIMLNTVGAVIGFLIGRFFPDLYNITPGAAVIRQPGLVRRSVAFLIDTIIVYVMTVLVVAFLHVVVQVPLDQLRVWRLAIHWSTWLIIELVVPLLFRGFTPGGRATGISLDAADWRPLHRLLFYLVRFGYIVVWLSGLLPLPLLALITLGSWWRYKQLPYAVINRLWPATSRPK